MAHLLTTLRDLRDHPFDEIIDVRSPAEFAEDHIPGAVNLPVLSNEERAAVGTLYVRVDRFEARRVGGALVARNTAQHLEGHLKDKSGGYRPLVMCWRGGMRSGAFATILSAVGWRTETLEGGYKHYRGLVWRALYETPWPVPLILLSGHTGTAKTELLHRVSAAGGQVIDLEAMAGHRGSLFGSMGPQPSQKQFESRLAAALRALDPTKPVLVEAESAKIGDRVIPPSLWQAMRTAPRIELRAPLAERAHYTAERYKEHVSDIRRLRSVLEKLRPYHARERIAHWIDLAERADHPALAEELMRYHYDTRYTVQEERQPAATLDTLPISLSEAGLSDAAVAIHDLIRSG